MCTLCCVLVGEVMIDQRLDLMTSGFFPSPWFCDSVTLSSPPEVLMELGVLPVEP